MKNEQINQLKNGGVAVLPTDTIYGLVASAWQPEAIERIYTLKQRNRAKPLVMVIGSIDDIASFDIALTDKQRQELGQVWPGPVSVVLECPDLDNRWAYLHRGLRSLAFRLPADDDFRHIVQQTGPLFTTSVNLEGQPPATTVAEAKAIFDDQVDFYIDSGSLSSKPSSLIRFNGDDIEVLR